MITHASYRMLIADDDPISRNLLQSMLLPITEMLTVVENGEQVLLALANDDYDIIFLDIHMPLMGGIEATKIIRSIFPDKQTPIIVAITASSDSATINECLDAGMNDCVTKPIDSGTLRYIVNKWSKVVATALHQHGEQRDESNLLNMQRIKELKDLERSSSTHAIIVDLIRMFRDECPTLLSDLKEAVKAHDTKNAVIISHRLRGSMLNLGLIAAASMCETLEKNAGNAESPIPISFVDNLEDLYVKSYKEFSQYLQSAA